MQKPSKSPERYTPGWLQGPYSEAALCIASSNQVNDSYQQELRQNQTTLRDS